MSRLAPTVVHATNLSRAWLETVAMARVDPSHKLFHTYTGITDPFAEDHTVRRACDGLLADWGKPDVEAVANTIFPAEMAISCDSAARLAERYRAAYRTLRRFPGNRKGTYFGRIVAYPGEGGERDQLTDLIAKLRSEAAHRGPKSARYEVGIAAPAVDHGVSVHTPDRDNGPMGFPCLSLCSFQLDEGRLHMLAHYRYEYLIEKAYGNYLGLARLLEYVATQANLQPGRLTVVAGRVYVDAPLGRVESHLGELMRDPSLS